MDRPVWSWNEWDPLEEVIVGRVEGAIVPAWDEIDYAAHSVEDHEELFAQQGKPLPNAAVEAAQKELDNFVHILEAEGVTVRRPDRVHYQSLRYATPDWKWDRGGFNGSNPRDVLLVVGDQVIEVPSIRKNRYYEVNAYRTLLKEYSRKGGRWISAPKPLLTSETFVQNYARPKATDSLLMKDASQMRYPHTEAEPVFEAADFMKCGQDIFYHRSFVTNQAGVDWLQRHLGDGFHFHEIETLCRRPIHIDTTFVPLAPGKALANPDFAPKLPAVLKKWDILYAPTPVPSPNKSPFQFGSDWLAMNVFSLDAERVLVDSLQEELIKKLRDWGLRPIPLPYQNYYAFGGGLHCSTLDIRRRGELQSYF